MGINYLRSPAKFRFGKYTAFQGRKLKSNRSLLYGYTEKQMAYFSHPGYYLGKFLHINKEIPVGIYAIPNWLNQGNYIRFIADEDGPSCYVAYG